MCMSADEMNDATNEKRPSDDRITDLTNLRSLKQKHNCQTP